MAIRQFDPVTTSLLNGINLIEASAGTGKTYTIAMLVLRFVVELNIPIDKLLVVTFTKAATEELKDRIRSRLTDAKRALEGNQQTQDATLSTWLAHLSLEHQEIKKRLHSALVDIDQAGIFTIHGFCQRVLKEHALESGQLFDSELINNLDPIIQNCADDFWRINVYSRQVREASILVSVFDSPDKLLSSIWPVPLDEQVYPKPENIDNQLAEIEKLIDTARQQFKSLVAKINDAISEGKFKTDFTNRFEAVSQQFESWMDGDAVNLPALDDIAMFTLTGMENGLNGNKFRKNKNQTSEERKQEFLEAFDTSVFDDLVQAIQKASLILRRFLLAYIQENLDRHLHQMNVMSYDQLISRLAEALSDAKGPLLCQELQQHYKVALIDEFQDTDQQQWQIFSTLFGHPEHFLYLIGDPKQAIYKFRGADIFSYFAAQDHAQHYFTLGKNWRSHPSLVAAVNTLFSRRHDVFLFDQLSYKPVEAALSREVGFIQQQNQELAPLVLWQLPESEAKTGYWKKGAAEMEFQIATVNGVINLLDGENQLTVDGVSSAIKPADIAILVRSNQQARDYQHCLLAAGVPAVLNSIESVFETIEAQHLYVLLLAIAHPGNQDYLRQALTIDWLGLDGQLLHQTINDENLFNDWLNRFQSYFAIWQKSGLMTMMNELLLQEAIAQQIAKTPMAERQLTNIHHLVELVQQAAIDEHLGILKSLDWLASAINDHRQSEDQQLRLESDEDAVKIVTMHRAKGLEYVIVFCPCLWQRSTRMSTETNLVRCHNQGKMIVDLGSDDFERNRQQALQEELAEDIRLLYVAVTRAKYRCYIAWADVRSEKQANQSALSYLLFADESQDWQQALLNNDFASQQAVLQSLAEQMPEAIEYHLLDVPGELAGSYHANKDQQQLSARKRTRSLVTFWQMSSYTALTALSMHEIPELPVDKAQELQLPDNELELALPKGAHTGNVIHELLEIMSFKALAEAENIDQQRDQICLRYGLHCQEPQVIDRLLQEVVLTPLSMQDLSFMLSNIEDKNCLKEMPFYLSIRDINVAQINEVLQDSPVVQPLSAKRLSGYLTGFIDLICEFGGRFYVMDYKTNWLPDYRPETMSAAMLEHNYGLQYWLYSVVLHRYLQSRLPDYQYEQHFGGVRYLFVRGMQKDRPRSGVYEDRPDQDRLERLGRLFTLSE